MATDDKSKLVSVCQSPLEIGELSFLVVDGIDAELRGGKLDASQKKQVIEAVRAGKHVELSVQAITFRQRDGSPNKNFLRFKTEKLGDIAASFVGKPMLLDHNKWEQTARMGTITQSELVDLPYGWAGFRQTFRVVKPHAVISVLDGTLDAYSIGWDPSGPVFCSVHKVNLRAKGRCGCWPGDRVEVDGKTEIAEYEWQSTEGLETSGVNTPAVTGTKNEDVRTALATELNLHTERVPEPPAKETSMKIVNATLGLAADATEEQVVRAITELRNRALAAEQERDTARAELAPLKKQLADATALAVKTQVDALIAGAYKEGKLKWGRDEEGKPVPSLREPRLRKIAEKDGIAELRAELSEMPIIVPLGQQQLSEDGASRERGPIGGGDNISSAADQLGLDPDELAEYAGGLYSQEG